MNWNDNVRSLRVSVCKQMNMLEEHTQSSCQFILTAVHSFWMVNKRERWHENPTTPRRDCWTHRMYVLVRRIEKEGKFSRDTLSLSLHALPSAAVRMLCNVVCTATYRLRCMRALCTYRMSLNAAQFYRHIIFPWRARTCTRHHRLRFIHFVAFVLICTALVYTKLLHCDVHVQCSLNPKHASDRDMCNMNTRVFIHRKFELLW